MRQPRPPTRPPTRSPKAGAPEESISDVAAALELLAAALASGAPVLHALDEVAAVSGAVVSSHLRTVAVALRWGVPASEAWDGVPDLWWPARQALCLAESTGAAPAALLAQAAQAIRRNEDARLEAGAARLGVLLVVPLGLCFLPAFFLIAVVPAVIALTRQLMPAV